MSIMIKNTRKMGRGIYTDCLIKKGELVQEVPLITLTNTKEVSMIMKTQLRYYVYSYKQGLAIAGGYGSFFNHSKNYNIEATLYIKKKVIKYFATKDILPGRQLFLNYGYHP